MTNIAYYLTIGLVIVLVVILGVFVVYSIREDILDAAVIEGTVVAIGYRKPYTTYITVNKVLIPQRHSGYWWFDVYNDEIGRTRRIKCEIPPIYQVGDYWKEVGK